MHTLVDTSALLIEPLWPKLEQFFGLMSVAALSIAFVLQSLPTSLSQVAFGYFRDRKANPKLLLWGPAFAVVGLTLIGVSPNQVVLCLLLLVGGIGVGAFHPEAAVLAGRLMPEARTRAMSIFMFGGSLGLAIGPTLSGYVVSRWGLNGLMYLTLPLLSLVLLLTYVGQLLTAESRIQKKSHSTKVLSLSETLEGKIGLAFMLLMICSFRLVPNMGMGKVLAFALEQQGKDTSMIGMIQSLFLISASVGMFVMAFRFRPGLERAFMIWCPLIGVPFMVVLGWQDCPQWLFIGTLIPTGMVLWGTSPAMVSYAQQLFPRGAGLASAITMGFSWGIGGLIQAPITAYFHHTGMPRQAYFAFIPCLILASLGAKFILPVITESQGDLDEANQPISDNSAAADTPSS
jgi:FSR family fosmidomycin resistance protein-like MFS transporter